MRRTLAIGSSIVAGLAGWTVIASYLFVAVAGLSGMLERPWLAWWLYAANSPDGWTTALLVVAAALPLAIVVGAAYRLNLLRFIPGWFARPAPQALYGDSRFATEADQRKGGISQSRSPFDA